MRSWFKEERQPTESQVRNAMIWSYDSYGDYQIKAGGGSKGDNIFVSHLRSTIADPVTGNDKDVVILKKYSNNFKDVLITIKEVEALQELTESPKVRESRRKDNVRGAIGFLFRCEGLGKYIDSKGKEVPKDIIDKMYKTTSENSSEKEINEMVDHIIKVRTEDAHGDYVGDTPEKIAERETKLQKQILALETVRKRLLGVSNTSEKDNSTRDLKGIRKPKYILKSDIKTVTLNRNGKEVIYKASDVYNGANMLSDGGDLTSKANYIPKRDVVEVELKDGSKVKPVNGYWVKKGAEPIGSELTNASSVNNETKVGETYIKKDARGNWKAETNVDNFNDYDWRISTIKTYSGKLISSAQGGKTKDTGTKGISMFQYTMYEDPNYTLEVSEPKRLTDKVVSEQHEKALAKFKKFMEKGVFKGGGKISNFDKLSAQVAKNYEGKPVKSKYQEEYGKYYSKEEAQEVGDKVAGKLRTMQTEKKAFGGLFGNIKDKVSPKKYPDLSNEILLTKDGKAVRVITQDGENLSVIETRLIGTGERPFKINISEIEPTSYKKGGVIVKLHAGKELFKEATILAKKIRKQGESWQDAKRRAFAQLKK
jgi:hypothetical protein